MNNTVAEYCPYCEGEAELEYKFVPQKCDICGHKLLPCAQCHQLHSVFGCGKCPFEIENIVIVKKYIGNSVEVLEDADGTFTDFYNKVNEYKEKYDIKEEDIINFFMICNSVSKEIYTHMGYELVTKDFVINVLINPKEKKYE